ncbi:hypothetical protein [Amycolatopsis taiwanensis]|uniref:Uncharacterized protein n=1 Tax=Amycolatopsis taiwanensis TaxID=342230 RepID=A0A9W6QZE6_9PSEU|nr:hypothetical protein [Amycolatopsis taiwanensis]GLY66791.1 hypothetical protein Atai01_34100 [Amycolatopsis taiwanensis]
MTTVEQQFHAFQPGLGESGLPSMDRAGDERLAFYRRLFGWPVKPHRDGSVALVLENGLCAVVIPKLTSDRVIRNLDKAECHGPVLDLPTPRGARLVILAEADGIVPPANLLPKGVELLHSGAVVPLPSAQNFLTGWFRPPDPHQRWLPSLGAVLAIVQTCFW